jgi:hypothetical protein
VELLNLRKQINMGFEKDITKQVAEKLFSSEMSVLMKKTISILGKQQLNCLMVALLRM